MDLYNIISLLLNSGTITLLLFLKPKRRQANAEATGAEADVRSKIIQQYEAFIDSLNEELRSTKEELKAERSECREARKREAEER